MTEEETILWSELRQLRKQGLAFRRQAPIGPYIVDFLCRKAMLIIEVDGSHHSEEPQLSHDAERDEWLASHRYHILRFWNSDIRDNLNNVVDQIYAVASKRVQNRFPPTSGGGAMSDANGGGGESRPFSNVDLPPPSDGLRPCPPPPRGRGKADK